MRKSTIGSAPSAASARELVAEIERAWNERDPGKIAANYEPDAAVMRAGELVAECDGVEAWADSVLKARESVTLKITMRAFTAPYACLEYVVCFIADGAPQAVAGAEILQLGPSGRILRQHIYPVPVAAGAPLIAELTRSKREG